MKKVFLMLLALMLALACTVAGAETLTAVQKGFGGDVTVTVETDEAGKIVSIVAEGASETEGLGKAVIEKYNAEDFAAFVGQDAVAADFSAIDTVAGSTVTSEAVKAALASLFVEEASADAAKVAELESKLAAAEKTIADFEAGTAISKPALSAWLADRRNVAAARGGRFLPGDENAPTNEELERIMHTANNYMWCHGLSAPHFIIIRDPEEQAKLLGSMGITGDGTVTVLVLADGVSDQEHHKEPYTGRDIGNADEHYWRMYYCIYEAGEAASMLNLAAISEGYRVRSYGAIDLFNQGVKDQFPESDGISIWFAGGNFDYIGGANWDISKYTSSKDGSEKFMHWFEGGKNEAGESWRGREVEVDGNLTLLCAIVIGTIDESNPESNTSCYTTSNGQNNNYNFWD